MRRLLVILFAVGLLMPSMTAVAAGPSDPPRQENRQRVIVILAPGAGDPGEVAAELTSSAGGKLGGVYRHALQGFVAEVPISAIRGLRNNPKVAFVEIDQVAHIAAQEFPTGADRIEVDKSPPAAVDGVDDPLDVDIAILDTGIDLDHPDLNASATRATNCLPFGFSCNDGTAGDDDNGHGSHVAGSAAARDNGIGVVGVAPGARLWAVKVLDSGGNGSISAIIAGIDWVTARASQIEVANMSLGCECFSSALNTAIANSVSAGITYVVAAGNNARDASTFSPANHPDVITVSALSDFNGLGGGGAAPTCRLDEDDTLANFSNYGSLVELAAPGVCITSTWRGGGYNTISGTSMASPHVAGAAALYVATNGPTTPANLLVALLDEALPQSHACGFTNEWLAQGSDEPLLFVNGTGFGGDGTCDYVTPPPVSGPSGFWALDDGSGGVASDSSGHGRDGVLVNGPVWVGVARVGGGLSFDGSNDRVDVPAAALDGASDASAALWVKTAKTGQQGLVSGARAGDDNEFLVFLQSSTRVWFYTAGKVFEWVVPSLADDAWHHLAVTRDAGGSRVELFVDGVSKGARTVSLGTMSIANGGLVLAQEQDSVGGGFSSAQAFAGTLDEVYLYTRVLTPTEIADLANP